MSVSVSESVCVCVRERGGSEGLSVCMSELRCILNFTNFLIVSLCVYIVCVHDSMIVYNNLSPAVTFVPAGSL